MHINLGRFLTALTVFSSLTVASFATTLEAPITISAVISATGAESQRSSKGGIDYKASMMTFKFTNREYLESLVDEHIISSSKGWKLVARWTAGEDSIEDYQFYLVKKGATPIALDDDHGFGLELGALAASYSERAVNGVTVSGSGKIKFATAFNLDVDGDQFVMGGIGTGSYSIKALTKGGAPKLSFSSIKVALLGGLTAEDIEAVMEMTLSIGKPVVIPSPPSQSYTGGSVAVLANNPHILSNNLSILNNTGSSNLLSFSSTGGTLTIFPSGLDSLPGTTRVATTAGTILFSEYIAINPSVRQSTSKYTATNTNGVVILTPVN